jgi:hypothetical protein
MQQLFVIAAIGVGAAVVVGPFAPLAIRMGRGIQTLVSWILREVSKHRSNRFAGQKGGIFRAEPSGLGGDK